MKKEYKLVGKVTIPEKKRKEVKSIIQKILYLGGIREKETIEIDGPAMHNGRNTKVECTRRY